MRWLIAAAFPALALSAGADEAKVTLHLPVQDVMLITQTVGVIGCATVTQLALCNRALALLEEIKRQVREQEKR